VNNLLRIFRGEVPYERVKGLDPRIIDRPFLTADAQLRQDADWLVENYEPRAEIINLSVDQVDTPAGGFAVTAEIEEREG
jgi:hypothetical protein